VLEAGHLVAVLGPSKVNASGSRLYSGVFSHDPDLEDAVLAGGP
jgi:hypothetical protein